MLHAPTLCVCHEKKSALSPFFFSSRLADWLSRGAAQHARPLLPQAARSPRRPGFRRDTDRCCAMAPIPLTYAYAAMLIALRPRVSPVAQQASRQRSMPHRCCAFCGAPCCLLRLLRRFRLRGWQRRLFAAPHVMSRAPHKRNAACEQRDRRQLRMRGLCPAKARPDVAARPLLPPIRHA